MCRFLAYKGPPILLDKLLYQPKNSLIHQSYHALERNDPVNGDGFGIGWYVPEISSEPVLHISTRPAWNDQNLRSLAPKMQSGCVFAHVRDASIGIVTESNCHPFQYGRFLMMHNGNLDGFQRIKRRMRENLSDRVYNWISGETDSEHFFAIFLDRLFTAESDEIDHVSIAGALTSAIRHVKEIYSEANPGEHFFLNVAITDGNCIVACRFGTDPEEESPTLYHSSGGQFECKDGVCRMLPESDRRSMLIASEKLTDVREDWHKIPEQNIVMVTKDLDILVQPVDA